MRAYIIVNGIQNGETIVADGIVKIKHDPPTVDDIEEIKKDWSKVTNCENVFITTLIPVKESED